MPIVITRHTYPPRMTKVENREIYFTVISYNNRIMLLYVVRRATVLTRFRFGFIYLLFRFCLLLIAYNPKLSRIRFSLLFITIIIVMLKKHFIFVVVFAFGITMTNRYTSIELKYPLLLVFAVHSIAITLIIIIIRVLVLPND